MSFGVNRVWRVAFLAGAGLVSWRILNAQRFTAQAKTSPAAKHIQRGSSYFSPQHAARNFSGVPQNGVANKGLEGIAVTGARLEGFALEREPDSSSTLLELPQSSRGYVRFSVQLKYGNVPTAHLRAYWRTLRARLHLTHADGRPAGLLLSPRDAQGAVGVEDFATSVPFVADGQRGPITGWVEIFDQAGRRLGRSRPQSLALVPLSLSVNYGKWKLSSTPNTYERRIYVVVRDRIRKKRAFTDRVPVALRIEPAPGTMTVPRASWLSVSQGLSVRDEQYASLVSERLDDTEWPFTAVQYWRETPGGTHQLNTYRVRATLVDEKANPDVMRPVPSQRPNSSAVPKPKPLSSQKVPARQDTHLSQRSRPRPGSQP